MPKATVNLDEVEKFPLKTCEGGYVTVRRMPYGSWLKRQEMAMQWKMHGMDKKNPETEILTMQRNVTVYEFAQCITEHNLEDNDGNPLDFRKPHTIDMLEPRIGNEIASYISKLHEFEDDLGNLQVGSTIS